jgi:hypothetical protein
MNKCTLEKAFIKFLFEACKPNAYELSLLPIQISLQIKWAPQASSQLENLMSST